MAEQFHEKVFERMLADAQRYPALSLLYAAHLRNPEQVRRGELNRRRFFRAAAGALALPYLALARAKERVQNPPPLPQNELVGRAVLSHVGLSLAQLARNGADWACFVSAAGALERMKQKVLFTNLPQSVQERLLPGAELVTPSFKSGSFRAWSKSPGSFAADAIGTGAGITAALHSLAFVSGVPRTGLDLSFLFGVATGSEAATYAREVRKLNGLFSEKRLDAELSRLHNIVRAVEAEEGGRPNGGRRKR